MAVRRGTVSACFGCDLLTVWMFAELWCLKTSGTDTFGTGCAVRLTGNARLFAQRGVIKHGYEEKLLGTGQNRSFKRGVRPTRVFVRRGSTVYVLSLSPA